MQTPTLPSIPATAPERRSRRRPWVWAGALVVVAAVVAGAVLGDVAISRQRSSIVRVQARISTMQRKIGAMNDAIGELRDRVQVLEQGVPPDLVELVARIRESVYVVRAGRSQGTAWVVRSSGGRSLLLTNFHVVAPVWTSGHRDVQLTRGGDEPRPGRLLRVDMQKDLALIAVDATLPALDVTPEPPDVGDHVVVVGAPFGLEGTVGDGIVSGKQDRFIQFSAPISPGDSGAPVVDEQGLVVGIAAAKIAEPGAEGLSFAIPISVVCRTIIDC